MSIVYTAEFLCLMLNLGSGTGVLRIEGQGGFSWKRGKLKAGWSMQVHEICCYQHIKSSSSARAQNDRPTSLLLVPQQLQVFSRDIFTFGRGTIRQSSYVKRILPFTGRVEACGLEDAIPTISGVKVARWLLTKYNA